MFRYPSSLKYMKLELQAFHNSLKICLHMYINVMLTAQLSMYMWTDVYAYVSVHMCIPHMCITDRLSWIQVIQNLFIRQGKRSFKIISSLRL